MNSSVAQNYINSRQEELQYSDDAMHKMWGGYNQFKKQAEVLHREASLLKARGKGIDWGMAEEYNRIRSHSALRYGRPAFEVKLSLTLT